MNKLSKTVVLVEFHDGGHNRTFYLAHLRALVESGSKVLAIAPFVDEIRGLLPEQTRSSIIFKSNRTEIKWRGRIRRYLRALKGGVLESLFFGNLIRSIWSASKKHNFSVDMCYFSCIYESEFAHAWVWKRFTPWQWSGLYLHIWGYRDSVDAFKQSGHDFNPEDLFKSSKLHSLSVLDEGAVEWVNRRIDKPVYTHPDLIETAVNAEGKLFAERIRRMAKGRFIVCLAGSLTPTKGLGEFIEIAKQRNANLYFVILGQLNATTAESIDHEYVLRASNGEIDNCWAYLDRTESEEVFNGVFLASDLVWAAYRNFPHSSNIQGKAAAFGKPCIVSTGYLMAERCRVYELGTVVEEANIAALSAAINYYVDNENLYQWQSMTHGGDFLKEQSYEKLVAMFSNILND